MAILSHADYLHRWTAPAPLGFGQIGCPPCYHEYLQREIYKQDYLDLFINVKSFERKDDIIADRFYVKITGNIILGGLVVPDHDKYTTLYNGDKYLLLDYDYPWTDEELKKKRCIKYAMIGEAAPQQNTKIVGYGVDDKKNSFYYNILHIKGTGYFTAPLATFGFAGVINSSNNKRNALLYLANASNILLDIFPYAINYDPIRDYLNTNGVTEFYFQELMNAIILFKTKYKCKEDVKGVFVAPPKISHWLANIVNGGLIVPIIFRFGNNTFITPYFLNSPLFYHHIPAGRLLVGIGPLVYHLTGLTKTPFLASCAYGGTGLVPHHIFIKNALGLV